MDYERSAKRRKTGISENVVHGTVTTTVESTVKPTNSQNDTSYNNSNGDSGKAIDGAASAEAIWLKAKGQSASYRARARANQSRQRTSNVVLNDPAESHRSGKHADTVQQSAGKLKPVKKHLDPLRNHRQVSISPQKDALKSPGSSALGFFKQFRSPKVPPQGTNSPLNLRDKLVQARAESERINGLNNVERDVIDVEDFEDELARDIPKPSVSGRNGQPAEKEPAENLKDLGKPKPVAHRTFEDEIREIEEKAQEKAHREEDEDADAIRRTGRRPCPKRMMDEQDPNMDDNIVVTKAPDRRKTKTPSHSQNSPEPSKVSEIKKRQKTVSSPSHKPTTYEQIKVSTTPLKSALGTVIPTKRSINIEHAHLQNLKSILLEKITGNRPVKLVNLDEEHVKVSNVLIQTITAGESNSLLLIGARGSGKSALLDTILREQTGRHVDQFHVVRLNGFLQTDDKIALREIWRQLGRDMGVLDEHEGSSRNVADTLATLLALLSHPTEMGQDSAQDQVSKSVVFILEEFDLFTHHPRQTLLYNLFDIAQSRKAPIAVIGLTTRFNVTEQLEKRVKSRFSHRYVHLSLPRNFTAFQNVIKSALAISDDDLSNTQSGTKDQGGLKESWSAVIEQLLANAALENHLRRIYNTTKLVSDAFASFIVPLATLPTTAALTSEAVIEHFTSSLAANYVLPPDSKLTLLSSLSTLQMALLICAARLVAIYSMDTVNFLLVYEEYKALASKAKLQATASGIAGPGAGARLWSKDVAKGAWEELLEMGLILEDGRAGAGSGRCEVGLEEIGRSNVDLGNWGRWCREI